MKYGSFEQGQSEVPPGPKPIDKKAAQGVELQWYLENEELRKKVPYFNDLCCLIERYTWPASDMTLRAW